MPKCYFHKVAMQSNFIEITRLYGCSPVHLLHIFRTLFPKNTSGVLLLYSGSCKISMTELFCVNSKRLAVNPFMHNVVKWPNIL